MQPWTAKQKLLPKDEEWVRDSDLLPPKLSWRSRLFLKVERWSWGELSPQAVQALAAKAVQDFEACGAKAPTDLKALAKLGSSGVHPNHMRAQIVKITEAACRMPPLHRSSSSPGEISPSS